MSSAAPLATLPSDHLDHPEQWATGGEPATSKQKGFIKVLEGQHQDLVPEEDLDVDKMGKSEASEVIDKLKNDTSVIDHHEESKPLEEGEDAAPTGMEQMDQSKVEDDRSGEEKNEEEVEAKEGEEVRALESKKRKGLETSSTEDEKRTSKPDGYEKEHDSLEEGKEEEEEEPPAKAARVDDTDEQTSTTNVQGGQAPPEGGKTVPGDDQHLEHPENWTTGDEPATDKQKGFIAVLEKQQGTEATDKASLGKSEASAKIEELKSQ